MTADIAYFDDEPDQLIGAARVVRAARRFAEYVPPGGLEGSEQAAAAANLWVFDFFNDDQDRSNPGLGGISSNGLSIFQQFRRLLGDARPPTVVVSNNLEEALGVEIIPDKRHIIAEQAGVEWVAHKIHENGNAVPELLALADAVAELRSLSAELNAVGAIDYVGELAWSALRLPKNVEWTRSAISDVAAWRPPTWIGSALDQRSALLKAKLPAHADLQSARAIVSWMLRQALPFASFLVRDRHVAIRLGLSLECVCAALKAETLLSRQMKRIRYKGILADFDGVRWWSAGVDAIAWNISKQKKARTDFLKKILDPITVDELAFVDPVAVSDADLVETDEIAPAIECVRAAEDHFPPHAPPAWVKIEAARRDKVLARKVKLDDQSVLASQN